jgi:hypothetical protein
MFWLGGRILGGTGFTLLLVVNELVDGFDGCFDSRWDLDAWTRDNFEGGFGGRPHERRVSGKEDFCIAAVC